MENPTEQNARPLELDERSKRIQSLNDMFRSTLQGGRVLLTPRVAELPPHIQARVIEAIQTFDTFNEENDPYGTHEFGNVQIDGQAFWFKIDAYDANLEYGSPDPSDPNVTQRVMTILTPLEY